MTSLFSHPRTYSPAPWPPKVGELVVIRQKTVGDENGLNGFCAVVKGFTASRALIQLLDSEDKKWLEFDQEEVISTGKTPADLLAEFMPTDLEFSEALRIERSLPDFNLFKRPSKKGTGVKKTKTKKSEKELSPEQVSLLKKLIIAKLKEIKET